MANTFTGTVVDNTEEIHAAWDRAKGVGITLEESKAAYVESMRTKGHLLVVTFDDARSIDVANTQDNEYLGATIPEDFAKDLKAGQKVAGTFDAENPMDEAQVTQIVAL